MAIVPDLSGNFPASLPSGVDRNYAGVSRDVVGNPFSVTTPLFSGEVVRDSTSGALYQAIGLTNTSWVAAEIAA
jgi:hypothetical protein